VIRIWPIGRAAAGRSDRRKFCNDLNGPKTPKMSERLLKTPQDFPTSKLNTGRTVRRLFKLPPLPNVGIGGCASVI
jgi:hypothetical protein